MNWLQWSIIAAVTVSVVSGYALNYRHIFDVARRLKNLRVFSQHNDDSDRAILRSLPLLPPGDIGAKDLRKSFDGLVEYARTAKPDWILGVEPGGRLLSVALIDQLGMKREQCLHVSSEPNQHASFTFRPNPNHIANRIDGCMLVVDDILRTGTTLRHLKSTLRAMNFASNLQLSSVRFATLVIVTNLDSILFSVVPDWVYYRADDNGCIFPWSGQGSRVHVAYQNRLDNVLYDHAAIEAYERLVSDFDYALGIAKSNLHLH